MKLSTKGRYGLRALIDLAQYSGQAPVSITSISARRIFRNAIWNS